jgi:hypothetical protein
MIVEEELISLGENEEYEKGDMLSVEKVSGCGVEVMSAVS